MSKITQKDIDAHDTSIVTDKGVKPRGWVASLLRTAGFRGNVVDPDPDASGRRFDLPGQREDWLRAQKAVKGTDLHDYERAVACMVAGNGKRQLGAETVMFIEGKLYVQYPDEDVIFRYIPEEPTDELRDFFDKNAKAPKRFMVGFRIAKGAERLEYRRKQRNKNHRKPASPKMEDRYTGNRPKITAHVPNPEVRNGILIAERAKSKR